MFIDVNHAKFRILLHLQRGRPCKIRTLVRILSEGFASSETLAIVELKPERLKQ